MRLVILGAGGYGQTVADLARQSGMYDTILFLDDNASGADIVGKCTDFLQFANNDTQMYPAFGNNASRLAWMDRLENAGIQLPVLVHVTAYVSPTAQIERGTVILPKAVVNTGCQVKRGCIVNCGALIDHGCIIEEGVHVCLGAIIKAENRIPAGSKIEAGEVVQNRMFPV